MCYCQSNFLYVHISVGVVVGLLAKEDFKGAFR